MQQKIPTGRKKNDLRPTLLEPPRWMFPAATAASVLGATYFLARLLGAGGPGLGFGPYMLLLLSAGLALLPMSRERVEIDEEKIVRFRNGNVVARCKTSDLEDLQITLLAKTLVFRCGTRIKLYDQWSNVDRVTAVLRQLIETRARRERERQLRSGNVLPRSA